MVFGPPPWRLVATCTRGLEEVLAGELRELGAGDVAPGAGSVSFAGDLAAVHEANVRLRTAMRILVTLVRGRTPGRKGLYALASRVPWEDLIPPGSTFAVETVGKAPGLEHSGFAALVVKDAVADRIRGRRGTRPDVDRRNPDLRIHVHLGRHGTSISLDSTGEPLSRRGYRRHGGAAPLAETLAAGLLLLAGYDGGAPFTDPLCGSGTLVAEAALIASRTAPGLRRSFAFERWPFHDPAVLDDVRHRAALDRREPPRPIRGADRSRRAVATAGENLRRAGMHRWVELAVADVREMAPLEPGTLVVTNPPYGERLGETTGLEGFYRELGDALKRRAAGCTAWLLVGNRELAGAIGLRASRRIRLFNGPIECRFLRFDLYEGSRRHGEGGDTGVGE